MVQRHTKSGSSQRRGLLACLFADLSLLKAGSGDGASLRECRVEICSGVEQVAQNIPGADDVLEPEIERGQPKPQDIRRTKVADHAAGDERLAERIGVGVAEADMAAAQRRVAR